MILDIEFYSLVQGNMSILDYCHRLKSMVDALGDLDEIVLDRTLVLIVLCDLNERFSHMVSHLKGQRPLPMFAEVCNNLQFEKIEMALKLGSS
jgi:hypothetical protein